MLSVLVLFNGCASSVEQAETVGKLPVGPNWTEDGTLLHYELDFLGEVNGLGLYQEYHETMAANVPHGRARLLLVDEERTIVALYNPWAPFAKELVEGVLYLDCDINNTMDFSDGPPDQVAVCGQLMDLHWQ